LRFLGAIALLIALSACQPQSTADSAARPGPAPIEQTRLKPIVDGRTAGRDARVCAAWQFTEADFARVFPRMREVPPVQWYPRCYQLACGVAGRMDVEGALQDVEVNAGGWVRLPPKAGGTEPRYFILASSDPAFRMVCDCCDDGS